MKKLLFILFFVASGIYLGAQENQKIDLSVFPETIMAEPNPPKPIKGWEMVEIANQETALIGEYPGKIIKFQFKGDAVGIEVKTTPEAGIVEYSIDASEWEKLDLYSPTNMENQTSVYYTLGKDLKNRKHTLQLRLSEEKNQASTGTKCILRHFYFNAPK